MKLKSIFAAAAFMAAAFSAEALVGVEQYIPDSSGEYVYYKDSTFSRESYIGFLYYDEGTYGMRYYAPANAESPAKAVELLISVDPSKDHVDMTGERFITQPTPEDTDVINYMHDIFYELTARRQKAGEIKAFDYSKSKQKFTDEGYAVPQDDFTQFGGKATILFDAVVPIFNVKKITDYKGDVVFRAVTAGHITGMEDTAFSNFVPYQEIKNPAKTDAPAPAKKSALTMKIELEGMKALQHSVQADKNWKSQGNSFLWTYGDKALANFTGFEYNEQDKLMADSQLIRMFTESSTANLTDWNSYDIRIVKGVLKISGTKQSKGSRPVHEVRMISKHSGSIYSAFILSVYLDEYNSNRGYYDAIVKSYK